MCRALEQLSPRERDVLSLVSAGHGNKEVARLLDPPCREGTVRAHLKSIYLKLGVNSRTAAAAAWFKHTTGTGTEGEA